MRHIIYEKDHIHSAGFLNSFIIKSLLNPQAPVANQRENLERSKIYNENNQGVLIL